MRIIQVVESSRPLKSNLSNAYISFADVAVTVVAVVTDVMRDGERVIGYGWSSRGRYGQ